MKTKLREILVQETLTNICKWTSGIKGFKSVEYEYLKFKFHKIKCIYYLFLSDFTFKMTKTNYREVLLEHPVIKSLAQTCTSSAEITVKL